MDFIPKFQNTDHFIWIGNEAIYIWDRRNAAQHEIRYLEEHIPPIPYLPRFSAVWEEPLYYRKELQKVIVKKVLHRYRVSMAIPEMGARRKSAGRTFIKTARQN